jgi:hypothetical protein
MTNEISAAAERVRRMRRGESYVAVYGTESAIGNRLGGLSILDERLLADACLSLIAERDETTIGEAWLRSIGFYDDEYGELRIEQERTADYSMCLVWECRNLRMSIGNRRGSHTSLVTVPDVFYRGQVLSLCRALHIPTTDAGAK